MKAFTTLSISPADSPENSYRSHLTRSLICTGFSYPHKCHVSPPTSCLYPSLSTLCSRKPPLLFSTCLFLSGMVPSFTGRWLVRVLSVDGFGREKLDSHSGSSRITNSKKTTSLWLVVAILPSSREKKVLSREGGSLSTPGHSHD